MIIEEQIVMLKERKTIESKHRNLPFILFENIHLLILFIYF